MPRTFLDDLGFSCFTELGLGVLICKMRGLKQIIQKSPSGSKNSDCKNICFIGINLIFNSSKQFENAVQNN